MPASNISQNRFKLFVVVNLPKGAENRATESSLPSWARQPGDHINERNDALVRLISSHSS